MLHLFTHVIFFFFQTAKVSVKYTLQVTMDSEEETLYDDVDSGNESSDGDDVDIVMEIDYNNLREKANEVEEYPFEVLSTEEIVQHMVDSIKEVNSVVEVSLDLKICCLLACYQCSTSLLIDINFY